MEVWFLFIVMIVMMLGMAFLRKWYDYPTLIAFAIGFIINANIYNGFTYPVEFCGITFSMDCFLYAGFMYCGVVTLNEYTPRRAKIMALSSICAVLLSAVIEFFGEISVRGWDEQILYKMLAYFVSAFSTYAAIWIPVYLYKTLKGKINDFLNLIIFVVLGILIHAAIYLPVYALAFNKLEQLGSVYAGYLIGSAVTLPFCWVCYLINTRLWIPRALMNKYTCVLKRKEDNNGK